MARSPRGNPCAVHIYYLKVLVCFQVLNYAQLLDEAIVHQNVTLDDLEAFYLASPNCRILQGQRFILLPTIES